MNQDEKGRKTPDAKKRKGFYAALYSCVGVMLVLAAVIGYNNMTSGNKANVKNETAQGTANSALADSSQDKSYLYSSPTDNGDMAKKTTPIPAPTVRPAATQAPANKPAQTPAITTQKPVSVDDNGSATDENAIIAVPAADDQNNAAAAPAVDQSDEAAPVANVEEPAQEKTFTAFTDGDTLDWPLVGDIVMDFSADRVVYDKTLDQYRTNNVLCIAGDLGAPVSAAAAGKVTDIYTTNEDGKSVVIDMGNGWTTTYSQLGDNVAVNVGDVVETGQNIGYVGSPSIYTVLLGSHLGFEVEKDSVAVNPTDLLVSN